MCGKIVIVTSCNLRTTSVEVTVSYCSTRSLSPSGEFGDRKEEDSWLSPSDMALLIARHLHDYITG